MTQQRVLQNAVERILCGYVPPAISIQREEKQRRFNILTYHAPSLEIFKSHEAKFCENYALYSPHPRE